MPALAKPLAHMSPAGPAPITSTSTSDSFTKEIGIMNDEWRRVTTGQTLVRWRTQEEADKVVYGRLYPFYTITVAAHNPHSGPSRTVIAWTNLHVVGINCPLKEWPTVQQVCSERSSLLIENDYLSLARIHDREPP